MCSTACSPVLHLSISPLLSFPSRTRAARAKLSSTDSIFSQFRQVSSRGRVLRVVRVRGLADEAGGSEKAGVDSTGDNGKSSAAVASSSSSSSSVSTGSTKGFGPSARPGSTKPSSKEKKKPGTVRRNAPEKPLIQSAPADNQMSQLETAYVASLTFLFALIFAEGIALAASGFLPEEWDQFFVNTLYPSFTPTVGLFLLLAAGYGVFKYLGYGPSQE
ncbi:uncharacterized protein [Physcomitrium patens]|uniref:Uncharacterized protein n=1 Tax=Physcomitrium patens TaxID=3218 RepID=A9RFG3_PHYPA|nr:protein LOW PSII ACCUMULATION 2, chloroplastic-like [Physcomitrium patens]PNR27028.1 hypothetical protein PHYPA_030509 [Physcomitrium patens]|eukprot:XP_024366975.1 protein LOW PSII ACCUMULATION 2, chloroplastic-like [Physcomitrella patens]